MGKNAKRIREKMLREAAEADRPENRVHPQERLLPDDFIDRILQSGLLIDRFPFFVAAHVGAPSGYLVILPAESGGNCIGDWGGYYTDPEGEEALTFMPSLVIWGDGSQWHTKVDQYAPGPGPGDFRHTFLSLDEAFSDVISYFFDPTNENVVAAKSAI